MWRYHVETFVLTEKWSSKNQQAEIQKMIERLDELGALDWEMIGFHSIQTVGSITGKAKDPIYFGMFKRFKE